ncbi:MAG: recombination protein RecR [Kiritimatiellae bacterium]|jgi:recombination protein RecR|nr:recombination protein RecR [Kiritimatiellia bacterium]
MIAPVDELEKCLSKLPGFGRRSAQRAALSLVREPARLLEPLVAALEKARREVKCCSLCGAFTTVGNDPCAFCSDPLRADDVICVVEDPSDIVSIEGSGAFRGRYHALGGKLSPVRRMGPGRLRLAELQDRVVREGVGEVLLALSTDMDGDATAGYIAELLKGSGAKVTRLAFGLPADSGIAYSDPLTLRRAIANRIGC